MNRNFYPKKIRLLTSNEFTYVFQQSKKLKISGITFFSKKNQLAFPRMGLSISKKYIRHAHERNRIKRYIRESFRMHQHNILTADFVITIHSKEVVNLTNHVLKSILEKLWFRHYLS